MTIHGIDGRHGIAAIRNINIISIRRNRRAGGAASMLEIAFEGDGEFALFQIKIDGKYRGNAIKIRGADIDPGTLRMYGRGVGNRPAPTPKNRSNFFDDFRVDPPISWHDAIGDLLESIIAVRWLHRQL